MLYSLLPFLSVLVYGYFTSVAFEEDTRTFYILGSSSDENSVLYGTVYGNLKRVAKVQIQSNAIFVATVFIRFNEFLRRFVGQLV